MPNNLIVLLDEYEAARANTDRLNLLRDGTAGAEAMHNTAVAAEDAAIDAAIKALHMLEPQRSYNTARGTIIMPKYRAQLRAQYGDTK